MRKACTREFLSLTLLAMSLLLAPALAHAKLPADSIKQIAMGDNDEKVAALSELAISADDNSRLFLEALSNDGVKTVGENRILIVTDEGLIDAISREKIAELPDEAEDIILNNRVRGAIGAALAALNISHADSAVRQKAITTLNDELNPAFLPLLDRALASEKDSALIEQLKQTRAALQLQSSDAATRLAAVKTLGDGSDPAARQRLLKILDKDGNSFVEPDANLRKAAREAVNAIDTRLARSEMVGSIFTGLSLGSILLLAALGLAITYGLMGVINMAHGELIMIGAYATYMVQSAMAQWLPDALAWYPIIAIPVAFLASALVGMAMERLVIRHLYGRALETLLATWGISLILMQSVRTLFGAQNVLVENPAWLSGGVTVMANLVLPYNRIAIMIFAGLVLLGVTLILTRTRLGLFVRAVTQNRAMASCVGVATPRIDTLAFGLGAGIAGLAGCALSQTGNVGPDLGQSYIVDSFMVVVLGGVGQLAGTVYAALGLGLMNKFIEGWAGAVLAKIAVLVFIIVFIQKRPQGIFALKGRFADN